MIRSQSIFEIAGAVRSGKVKAVDLAQAVVADIAARNSKYVCFTRILNDSAIADARAIDRKVESGIDPGPLAGVPFAVKDLYDIAGLPTTAGAKICTLTGNWMFQAAPWVHRTPSRDAPQAGTPGIR